MNSHNEHPLYTSFGGSSLLEISLLNKGSAFDARERREFNLEGLLPYTIETIEEQAERAYEQLRDMRDPLKKHVLLRNIQDTNETLFYRLVVDHLVEIMPLIYTPTVGDACQQFSRIYRRKRGLFVSYPDINRIDSILHSVTKNKVKVIVVTDGERILGLGDLGIGGMGIPIGKLAIYSACGGISPAYTLPITLDVGCDNRALVDDPMYMGWRHPRIRGEDYVEFINAFIASIKRLWPDVLLQFEDFAQVNASPILHRFRDDICCFNDDIQGTAAVAVGTLIAASRARGEQLSDQRIVFLGAGSAGCGIATQIIAQMQIEGLTEQQARQRVFMVDRFGLLMDNMPNLLPFQANLVQPQANLENWKVLDPHTISFIEVIKEAKPTALIGVSGQPGMFTKEVVEAMLQHTTNPIILPLSNPTSRAEGKPSDILHWAHGRAIIATGSPFDPVNVDGVEQIIPQCNNSYIFPGIGLAVIAAKARRVTDNMFLTASIALADLSPRASSGTGPLLPPLSSIREASRSIAQAVARQAMTDGVAPDITDEALNEAIENNFWHPKYRAYHRTSFN